VSEYREDIIRLDGGYEAYARWWEPPGSKGAILFHHGIQSHCGWYEASARRLKSAGYTLLQFDRRGCGRNTAARGHAESIDRLLSDAGHARDALLACTGRLRCFEIGVSWGGRLAVAAHVEDPNPRCALVLVTPGLFPRVGVTSEQAAQIGIAMIYERETRFDIPLGESERFTSDPRWQRFIEQDDLTLRQATAGFYLASRRMDRIIERLPAARPVPLFLALAGDERIIDNDRTRSFIHSLNWPETVVCEYPTSRHALEFEPAAPAFLDDLVAFLERVLDRG
jgi:alpha-beta hydrolase superfamily lysophospholipase